MEKEWFFTNDADIVGCLHRLQSEHSCLCYTIQKF
jgi:hypothetical protein